MVDKPACYDKIGSRGEKKGGGWGGGLDGPSEKTSKHLLPLYVK